MAGLTVHLMDANHCLATYGPLFFALWGEETTRDGVEPIVSLGKTLASAYPAGILSLSVVASNSRPPSSEVRALIASTIHALKNVKRSAVVVDGTGFLAAMVRGVVTGLQALQRAPYPHQVFGSVDVAIGWLLDGLAKDSPGRPSAIELLDAVRSAQAQFDEHRKARRAAR
ncbi:MAG: hypothetical protein U0359_06100 [Byssovorax sp.]